MRDDLDDSLIEELYKSYSLELIKICSIPQSEQDIDVSIIEKRKIIAIYTFIKSILSIIDILNSLITQWTSETTRIEHTIDSPSFNIDDSQKYFTSDAVVADTMSATPKQRRELGTVELMETGGSVKRRKFDGMRFK